MAAYALNIFSATGEEIYVENGIRNRITVHLTLRSKDLYYIPVQGRSERYTSKVLVDWFGSRGAYSFLNIKNISLKPVFPLVPVFPCVH